MIRVLKGDLLKTTMAEALVIPVNTVGVLGKGLAAAWAAQASFDDERAYRSHCAAGKARLGYVWATKRRPADTQTIFFPTKRHFRERSDIEAIRDGLVSLRAFILKNRIRSVAIPALGCGLGKLQWELVRPEIEEALSDLECDVYLFEPRPGKR